ncbi:hypothetical protein BD410DRAFT_828578 [Rickenella mellea]|uniref:Uncharacterized protein n=1 Tax=Rickenella mellea TaxID=50990 RepID=A0A4Y7Q499_9AGAM|nr:hypothetical protein BD410DRAFT_828578 [Rickenella mellea]
MASSTTSAVAILNDALSAFSHCATHALAIAEENGKAQTVANEQRLHRQVEDLKKEKEAANRDRFQMALDLEQSRRDVDRWKAIAEKAEVTINHQEETVAQTRREATQWKDQYLRGEEERTQWKDLYLRGETERARLSERIDSLVAERRLHNSQSAYPQEPLTPRSQHNLAEDSSHSSAATREADSYPSQSVVPETLAGPSNHTIFTPATHNARQSSSKAQNLFDDVPRASKPRIRTPGPHRRPIVTSPASEGSPSSRQNQQPLQRVIRRVHAVVNVHPVKEEEDDDDVAVVLSPPPVRRKASPYPKENPPVPGPTKRNVVNRMVGDKTKAKEPYARQVVSPEVQDSRSPESDEDEEDELMLGLEDNRNDIYSSSNGPTRREVHTPSRGGPQRQSPSKGQNSLGQKRKIDASEVGSSSGGRKRRH